MKINLLAGEYEQELKKRNLPAGSRIESVRELAKKFQISNGLADRILDRLAANDFLYRWPRHGAFIKYDPPAKLTIGYAGQVLSPTAHDIIQRDAINAMMRYLIDREVNYKIITYQQLARGDLDGVDSLIISGSFIDDSTLKHIRKFPGRKVAVNLDFPLDHLQTNQIMTDYHPALTELGELCDLNSYRNFMIIHAGHHNAVTLENIVRGFLEQNGISSRNIESVVIKRGQIPSALVTYQYFRSLPPHRYQNTLIFSLSGFISLGICEACDSGKMPDVLSFDNLAGHGHGDNNFTAIDRNMEKIYRTAVDLLRQPISESDEHKLIIKIPAYLIVRKSINNIHLKTRSKKNVDHVPA